jgi:hypothetical protein
MTATPTAPPQTDFLTVALAAWNRGFRWLTPVDDKRALREKWQKFNRTETLTGLRDVADDFPHAGVGIVMRHGVEEPFVIDIDKDIDVLGRLERETGETLPETYQVQSRPVTAPYKKHLFFRQTAYSCSLLKKQVTDVTDYTGYDLKGCGGAGYVVAEGCVRADTGEIRKGNGKDIAPIPDWLVDWLVEDIKTAKAKKRETLRHEAEQRREDSKRRKAEVEALRESGQLVPLRPEIEIVPVGRRHDYLWSLAGTFVKRGIAREVVEYVLVEQCKRRCVDGRELADSKDGRREIHDIAFSTKLKTGRIHPALLREKKPGHLVLTRTPSVWEGRLKSVKGFPNTITSAEMYKRLGLDGSNPKDRKTASRVMEAAGFRAARGRRETVWKRE